ncbi:UDP-N-acetylglucosamine 2-epimerase (non-hydrolyzing)/GDP/UDP-N,N'-diacetylbacillosamine 2-epimerase (hydrolyzing) [Kribbella aluminosa]|uniref:UDP-N-acetylglucosamine 2-epimerase (Non-hydrolyzing)/GDP/UDP-N,N'-diacetylbacillosamine 2-epimerase (Hydrolyzing) n=1 Tax=Kribbella aluminosa TaxID=416017 RepID=A0ABS4UDG0_9ACTN|nr:UDP-N-acetylglucosamine 2-epimerase (non-hydrolyzing)/GDP/UDP-N,N'-diacetylbacillosamine 2-epimerase (hydrolyzing) [Kribbella aluminosa]
MNHEPGIDLRLLVSGSHLVAEQGMTIDVIADDGHPISERVPVVVASDTPTGVAKSFGLGAIGYAEALERIAPDIVVLLGDRYEVLAAAVAAAFLRIPIAHICGGEVTAGSTDEGMRHAITKLSHLHFTATEEFSRRVVQMGEDPRRVYTVGSPGLDTVRTIQLLDKLSLSQKLGMKLATPTIAVTYHPATADPVGSEAGIRGLLAALDRLDQATVVFTGSNVDLGGPSTGHDLERFVARHSDRMLICPSLGQSGYLSLAQHADVVVGNSSSALIEVPALGTPTVNIGTRQEGRPISESTISCSDDAEAILIAIQQALAPEHRARAAAGTSPYGDGHAAVRILHVLKTTSLEGAFKKRFVDLVN